MLVTIAMPRWATLDELDGLLQQATAHLPPDTDWLPGAPFTMDSEMTMVCLVADA